MERMEEQLITYNCNIYFSNRIKHMQKYVLELCIGTERVGVLLHNALIVDHGRLIIMHSPMKLS